MLKIKRFKELVALFFTYMKDEGFSGTMKRAMGFFKRRLKAKKGRFLPPKEALEMQKSYVPSFENKTISMIDSLSKRLIPCATIPEHLKDRMDALIAMGGDKCNLIYVSSANKAVAYAMELSKQFDSQGDSRRAYPPELDDAAKQIETKYQKKTIVCNFAPIGIFNLANNNELIAPAKVYAFAGIGQPKFFFEYLEFYGR